MLMLLFFFFLNIQIQVCNICVCVSMHVCIHLTFLACVCGAASDVAGGYSASMLDAIRRALDTSKVLTIQNPENEKLTFEEVFRLATLGGSQGKKKSPAAKRS